MITILIACTLSDTVPQKDQGATELNMKFPSHNKNLTHGFTHCVKETEINLNRVNLHITT